MIPWLVVIIIRFFVPLAILRWPLAGFIAALLADNFDVAILSVFHTQDFSLYNPIDKWLDLYFLAIAFYTSLRWPNTLAKKTATYLFVYRLVGVLLYEITGLRMLLLIFPNLFGSFFIVYLLQKAILKRDLITTKKRLIGLLIILLIPKLIQEYLLHVLQYPIWGAIVHTVLPALGLGSLFR